MNHQSERTQVSQELSQKLKKSPLENKKKNKPMGKTLKIADLTWRVSKWKKQNKKEIHSKWTRAEKTAKMVSVRTARHPMSRAAGRPLTFDRDAELLALIHEIQQKYVHVTKPT